MKRLSCLLPLFLVTFIFIFTNAFAQQPDRIEVIGIQGSGWLTLSTSGVKRTLRLGDMLSDGQILELREGNNVRLQLDSEEENVIFIQGPSKVKVEPTGKGFFLRRGKMVALLDNLPVKTDFSIKTPEAIAAVRGTYFWVSRAQNLTETSVFKGTVGVSSNLSSRKHSESNYLYLGSNEKAIVQGGSNPASFEQSIEEADTQDISKIFEFFKKPRELPKKSRLKKMEKFQQVSQKLSPNSKLVRSDVTIDEIEDVEKGDGVRFDSGRQFF